MVIYTRGLAYRCESILRLDNGDGARIRYYDQADLIFGCLGLSAVPEENTDTLSDLTSAGCAVRPKGICNLSEFD